MKCPGDRDGNGCHESDFCVDRGYDSEGGLCPGYCPFECKIDENQCPGTEQCSTPTCKPKQANLPSFIKITGDKAVPTKRPIFSNPSNRVMVLALISNSNFS